MERQRRQRLETMVEERVGDVVYNMETNDEKIQHRKAETWLNDFNYQLFIVEAFSLSKVYTQYAIDFMRNRPGRPGLSRKSYLFPGVLTGCMSVPESHETNIMILPM